MSCHGRAEALAFLARARRRGRRGELVANVTRFRAGRVIEMVHHPTVAGALAAAGPPRNTAVADVPRAQPPQPGG